MILAAHAKINLALEIRGRRPDGYHEICTLFQSIELADTLELVAADGLELRVTGADVASGPDNLVWRAAEVLARDAGVPARARMHLDKRVPAGAGLGGGSSDAAAALVGLNALWRVGAHREDLYRLALELGSDVPFFLLGGTALGLGRGEQLWSLPDLPPHAVLIVPHSKPLATAEVYGLAAKRLTADERRTNNWCFPRIWSWDETALASLTNDLEEGAFQVFPELQRVKESLKDLGAVVSLLTGSGSAVYGLFRGQGGRRARQVLERRGVTTLLTRTLNRASYNRSRQAVEERDSRKPEEAP